jgi:hypothetical protein
VIDECLRERERERETEGEGEINGEKREKREEQREMEILKFDKINRKRKGGKEIGEKRKGKSE